MGREKRKISWFWQRWRKGAEIQEKQQDAQDLSGKVFSLWQAKEGKGIFSTNTIISYRKIGGLGGGEGGEKQEF